MDEWMTGWMDDWMDGWMIKCWMAQNMDGDGWMDSCGILDDQDDWMTNKSGGMIRFAKDGWMTA